jgi:hypothetical protein
MIKEQSVAEPPNRGWLATTFCLGTVWPPGQGGGLATPWSFVFFFKKKILDLNFKVKLKKINILIR